MSYSSLADYAFEIPETRNMSLNEMKIWASDLGLVIKNRTSIRVEMVRAFQKIVKDVLGEHLIPDIAEIISEYNKDDFVPKRESLRKKTHWMTEYNAALRHGDIVLSKEILIKMEEEKMISKLKTD